MIRATRCGSIYSSAQRFHSALSDSTQRRMSSAEISSRGLCRKTLDFSRRFLKRFDRPHPIAPDSHKTDGISVRKTAYRKTCEFLWPAEASLIGGFPMLHSRRFDFRHRIVPDSETHGNPVHWTCAENPAAFRNLSKGFFGWSVADFWHHAAASSDALETSGRLDVRMNACCFSAKAHVAVYEAIASSSG